MWGTYFTPHFVFSLSPRDKYMVQLSKSMISRHMAFGFSLTRGRCRRPGIVHFPKHVRKPAFRLLKLRKKKESTCAVEKEIKC